MSALLKKLVKERTLPQHRAAISQKRHHDHLSTQAALTVLAEAITDLNAAVVALLELEERRRERKVPKRRR